MIDRVGNFVQIVSKVQEFKKNVHLYKKFKDCAIWNRAAAYTLEIKGSKSVSSKM